MRGPFERLKYDLRRVWECPACAHKERTDGAVTARTCRCSNLPPGAAPINMRLISDGAVRVQPPFRMPVFEPDPEPSPAVVAEESPVATVAEPETAPLSEPAPSAEPLPESQSE